MVKQVFDIEDYWRVTAFYNVTSSLFSKVATELRYLGVNEDDIKTACYELFYRNAKAVTFSSKKKHLSVVVLTKHLSKEDFINSVVHEAEHVKQAMLDVYGIEDEDEPPAYTIGYLVSKMYRAFHDMICNCY